MALLCETMENMFLLLGIFLREGCEPNWKEARHSVINTIHSLVQSSEFSLWLYKALMKF